MLLFFNTTNVVLHETLSVERCTMFILFSALFHYFDFIFLTSKCKRSCNCFCGFQNKIFKYHMFHNAIIQKNLFVYIRTLHSFFLLYLNKLDLNCLCYFYHHFNSETWRLKDVYILYLLSCLVKGLKCYHSFKILYYGRKDSCRPDNQHFLKNHVNIILQYFFLLGVAPLLENLRKI